jgi:hypothetical protein
MVTVWTSEHPHQPFRGSGDTLADYSALEQDPRVHTFKTRAGTPALTRFFVEEPSLWMVWIDEEVTSRVPIPQPQRPAV